MREGAVDQGDAGWYGYLLGIKEWRESSHRILEERHPSQNHHRKEAHLTRCQNKQEHNDTQRVRTAHGWVRTVADIDTIAPFPSLFSLCVLG